MLLTGANYLTGLHDVQFDGHAHVFRSDLPLSPNRRYTPGYQAHFADYRTLLLKNGLSGALLVQPSFLGCDNSFLLNTLRNAGNKNNLIFRGIVVFDPNDKKIDSSYINRLTLEGVIGLRLNLVGIPQLQFFNLEPWDYILGLVDKAGWHVELHCEGLYLPQILEKLLGRCHTVVIDHFGRPSRNNLLDCEGVKSILKAPPNRVFVKTSAPYRIFPNVESKQAAFKVQPLFSLLFDYLGPEKLIWGSDWPWTQFESGHSYSQTLEWLGQWMHNLPTPPHAHQGPLGG